MTRLPITLLLLAASGIASAAIPRVDATCPGNLRVHARDGGPVYLNGKEARVKSFSDTYLEASNAEVTVSLSIDPDGTVQVSYTGKHKAHGICQVEPK
ncbi:hypothetical protein [Pseudomonas tohonis]|uniref:hypothetical protein n=1 Tax=Pseudomonas tohonis TaxID=2725477 RepID=UPI001F224397|nr:hypothetical protein [Pseudomonas tohonis]